MDGRDLGGVADEVAKRVKDSEKELPKGSHIVIRGQVQTMKTSFTGLAIGLLGAIVLAYLLIVVNFQSWLDPFIIITALPGALAGICWMLLITHTTLSVPSLTGAIMCMGVATANSILMVSFAREQMDEGKSPLGSRHRSRFRAHAPGHHDRVGDDHRYGAHGYRAWRRRRTKRAAGPRGHRRITVRNFRDFIFCTLRFFCDSWLAGKKKSARHGKQQREIQEHGGGAGMMSPGVMEQKDQTSAAKDPRVQQQPQEPRRSGLFLGLVVVAIVLVVAGAFTLLHRRSQYKALASETETMAVPTVSIVHPIAASDAEDLVLPSTLQAYVESPIYARTSGYLKKWYHDIGSRVRKGELLADIDAPEIDQQLAQSRAELGTAQANQSLSQITASRYQGLLKSDSVSKQEADNASGDLAAKRANTESAEANVRRLQETAGS